jgi:uncharacterized protein YbjT (DUF2867 family)
VKIVVTTPTGNVGSRVVRLLVQAGVRPTLLMRHPGKLDDEIAGLVDAVAADQGIAADVLRATEGADALFWVDPPTPDPDPIATSSRMGANAARAVRENSIARTVFQSSLGAEKGHGTGQIDGLARTEELLDGTGASVLHLRCGYFFSNLDADELADGVLRTAMPVDQPMPWVDPRDIGDIVAARLLSAEWSGRQVQAVHGPVDLSFADAAAIITEATGRKVRAEQVSDDDLRALLRSSGLGTRQIEGIVEMSSGLREDFVPENPRDILTTTPTTLGSWVYEFLK